MTTKRILVPISQSDPSTAVSVVRGVARDQGSTVRLLRVLPVPRAVVNDEGRTIAYADQETDRLMASGLRELELAEHELAGVPVERVVRFGEPAEEILLEAEAFNADLIALSTEPRSRLASILSPGISEKVQRAAAIPVLVLTD